MKTVVPIARILLGLMFLVFGLNGFVPFIPAPPLPGLAGTFIGILFTSHYAVLVFAVQVAGGILLLTDQFVPLALAVLAPVIANILVFHITMQPSGILPGLLAAILWIILARRYRAAFAPLLARKTPI